MKLLAEFALYPQDAPDWCWAAVVQMLQHHYLPRRQSQAEIIRHCRGSLNSGSVDPGEFGCATHHRARRMCLCANPCLEGLVWQVTGRNRALSWAMLCAELDAGRPVVIIWESHSVVCIGYDPVGRVLVTYNPLPVGRGRTEALPYLDYVNLFNSESWYGIQPAPRPQ
ncbi:MAG: hypothetical protein DCC57_08655 [Chloroflexi bacterium]|nr:MAG: hypothetical protein DCC57_08655 [Chloroflexota bacterium]